MTYFKSISISFFLIVKLVTSKEVNRENEDDDDDDDDVDRQQLQQQQQLQKLPPASISPQPSPTVSSSSIKKSSTKDRAPLAPSTSHTQVVDDSNDFENFEIIACTVQRREDFPGIGLSLSTAVNHPNRSVSPSSSKSPSTKALNEADNLQHLPIITNIDEKSPSQLSGLKVGDLVLEINGKSTNGQSNKDISNWIRSSGTTIEFVVSRAKHLNPPKQQQQQHQQQQQQIKDTAKIIAEDALQVAKTKVPDYLYHKEQEQKVDDLKRKPNENLHQIMVEAIQSSKNARDTTPPSSTHLSRKDSMTQQQRRPSLNATSQQQQQQQPHYATTSSQLEIQQMSSSKLQQDPVKTTSTSYRNQSEPPAPLGKPAIVSSSSSLSINSIEQQQQQQHSPSLSHTHQQQQQINLVKQRSQSSFTLPRDAPIPRLCRVRAYEDQLGFTVAGSKANRGVFKVKINSLSLGLESVSL